MVGQYCGCEEEKWKVAGMCGLHRSEQGLPKRSFPHALDRLAYGCHYRSSSDELLDTFQGYHKISLALDDQERTTFVTPIGNYHYKVMLFGLKNAGATYQRMMTKMFES